MQQIVESCRICGNSAYNLKSLYEYKKIKSDELECEKYLPAVIRSISGVHFELIEEPSAVICDACTDAILEAEVIIEKCRLSCGSQKQKEGRSLPKQGNQTKQPKDRGRAGNMEKLKDSLAEAISDVVAREQAQKCASENESDVALLFIGRVASPVNDLSIDKAPTQDFFVKNETSDTSTDSDSANLEFDWTVPNVQLERPQAKNGGTSTAIPARKLSLDLAQNKTKIVSNSACLENPTAKDFSRPPTMPPLAILGNNFEAKNASPDSLPSSHKKFHTKKRNYVRKVNKNKDYFFDCEQCDYKTPFASYYRSHLRDKHDVAHPRIFKCKLCPKDFIEYRYLQQHIRSDHQNLPKHRKYLCAECGRHFAKASNLQYHQTTHLPKSERAPVPTVSCRYCEGVYSIHSIRVHILSMHATDRSHFCTECQAAFALAKSLQAHMRTCHPTFVLRCPCCEVKFRVKSVYEAHVQRGDCQKLGFNCEYCAWGFKTKERLQKHYTTVHKNLRQLSAASGSEAN